MVLPEQEFKLPLRHGPELELIEGEVVFTRPTKLEDMKRMTYPRNSEVERALDSMQPREVLTTVMHGLQLTAESDRRIVAEQVMDEAVEIQQTGRVIDHDFDPDRKIKNSISPEEYDKRRMDYLSEMVSELDGNAQLLAEQGAAAVWHIDEILEEQGAEGADLLKAMNTIYQEADGFRAETAYDAYELGKISVALEKGYLD